MTWRRAVLIYRVLWLVEHGCVPVNIIGVIGNRYRALNGVSLLMELTPEILLSLLLSTQFRLHCSSNHALSVPLSTNTLFCVCVCVCLCVCVSACVCVLSFYVWRGKRFAFGHHYFRPHETHHSPSRRFYQNELFRMPLYEIIPLEAVVGNCCVLDLYTYCKGESTGSHTQTHAHMHTRTHTHTHTHAH